MSVGVPRGPRPELDDGVRQCAKVLERFIGEHPTARAEMYRHGRYSLRLRVTWQGFHGVEVSQRQKLFFKYLTPLPGEVFADIALVVLSTPQEHNNSVGSDEFDNPAPTRVENHYAATALD